MPGFRRSTGRRDRTATWGAEVARAAAGLSLAATVVMSTIAAVGSTVGVLVGRAVVTPPDQRRDPVRLHAIDPAASTVTLARTTESAAAGNYTLVYAAGRGSCRLGEIVSENERTVTRRYSDETGAALEEQQFVRVASAPERSIDDVGVPWGERRVPTELGDAPAWLFEAPGSRDWAIHVHGRGAVLTEPLRSVRLLHDEGWTSLVISYRNDLGAPRSPDGKFGLGATEWRDVEAAMAFALSRGAERLLLVGWSMGGATVMQALFASAHRDRVIGVVLESPVVSWRATLALQGRRLKLPWWVIRFTTWLLASPLAPLLVRTAAPIPIDAMELTRRAGDLRVPVLLFHSTGDTVVPYHPSARLARARPDLVTYEQFDEALHVRNWNVDAPRWERAWRQWVRQFTSVEEASAVSATSRE
ncbi:alpha/beta hydrolase family protein [Pseudoclavibacter endophyticus]|nr:prolyl oligopeptidase family serine peptidase [Pseudoclavibacter endophyticus]